MYIERIPNRNSPPAILIRESYRDEGKIKKRTLANLSKLPESVVELFSGALKQTTPLAEVTDSFQIERSLGHGHVAAVFGFLRKIGLDRILYSRPDPQRDLSIGMIVARIIDPASKLNNTRHFGTFEDDCCVSTLGIELDKTEITEDHLYSAMDWLLKRQKSIENKLAKKHLQDGCLVLYDVSSSYYTGTNCPLVKFGHNRDGKKRYPQIVYGLLCNSEGCPVAVEVFEGNTSDVRTLSSQIDKIRHRFGIKHVVIVGDRGMITSARIDEELRPAEGLDWISALKAPAIKKLRAQGEIEASLFDDRDLAEITSDDFPGERLMVCFNPLLARKRAKTREALLKRTKSDLDEIQKATQREKRALRGKDKIGLRIGKIINKRKVGKHFVLDIRKDGFTYHRDEEKIYEEAALDGIYVIRTSLPEKVMDAESTVRAYKSLSKVENAFRCFKTVDLKIRPIYHRNPDRVRAHVFLCMLAYYVEWHMRRNLSELIFDDEDVDEAEALRESIVAPAQRSDSAKKKDSSKRNSRGMPVQSFQALLDNLEQMTLSNIRVSKTQHIEMKSVPTKLQQRAFSLLGVSP